MGGYSKRITGKSTINEGKIVMQMESLSSALIRVPRDKVLSLPDPAWGDTLTNGGFAYKFKCLLQRVTCTWFSEHLPSVLFLKISQPTIIQRQRGTFQGDNFCSPTTPRL